MRKIKLPKLKCANYDDKTQYSYVELDTPLGVCYGSARVHPDDKDIPSRYLGCEIAEIRANIQYIKKNIAIVRTKIKTLKDFYKSLQNMKEFDKNDFIARKLRKAIFLQEKELEDFLKLEIQAKDQINIKLKAREVILNKIANGQKVETENKEK